MKTFTRFFALLFAFAIIGSTNLNAQNPAWGTVDGDGGSPLLEIWIYGLTVDGGAVTPEAGDWVAVYYGGTVVGILELSVVPAADNWLSSHLIAYSKNNSGTTLYEPGGAFLLEFWDDNTSIPYYAHTWGDGNHIDFHDTWWAPTSESTSATTTGAFFPPANSSSFCYVDLSFSDTQWDLAADIHVTVNDNTGTGITAGVTVTAGGYDGVQNGVTAVYDIDVFAGDIGDSDDYEYTVTVSHAGYTDESFTITVDGENGGGPGFPGFSHIAYLDAENDLSGTVQKKVLQSNGTVTTEDAENVLVKTTIFGTVYEDYTDANGDYTLTGLPDGTWDIDYSLYGYVTHTETIGWSHTGTVTSGSEDVTLDLLKGTIEGEIFDATTINTISANNAVKLFDLGDDPTTATPLATATVTGGEYELEYYPGTYQVYVTSTGYDPFTVEEHTFYSDFSETMNFNLLPTGTTAHFQDEAYGTDPIDGDPNDMWSIHIEMAKFGASHLLPFDEIAIYDITNTPNPGDSVLVGFLQLQKEGTYQNSGTNVLKTFTTTVSGENEFTVGHEMRFHGYDISHDEEYIVPLNWFFNTGVGNYSGTVFPDPATNPVSYLNIYWDAVAGELSGTVTETGVGAVSGVLVELLNVWTQEVIPGKTTTTDGSGNYDFNPLDAGTYDVRFTKAGYTTVIKEDQVVVQAQVTDVDVVFAARVEKSVEYRFTGIDWHFFGRCVEEKATGEDNMLVLLDMDGETETGAWGGTDKIFSDDYLTSWVKSGPSVADQAAGHLYYDNVTNNRWEPVGAGPPEADYDWDIDNGYQMFMNDALGYKFRFDGYVIDPSVSSISLSSGTSYIPYYPFDYDNPDDAIDAFAGIFDKLDWVMDEDGNRLHNDGGGWIDNIGTLDPTAGYKIKMNEAATLTYPSSKKKNATNRSFLEPVHYIFTGGNAADWTYTMYINTDEFEIGDEIAAFSNGEIVGSMVIDSDLAWENDLNTFNVTIEGGYEFGSDIVLKGWDRSTGVNYDLEYEMVPEVSDAYMGTNYPAGLDHFSYVNVYRGTVSVDKNHVDNNVRVYPNPTSTMLNIESVSNIKEVHVYNLYGALVDVINVNAAQQTLDVSSYTAGTYMIQLHTDTGVITKRVIIK